MQGNRGIASALLAGSDICTAARNLYVCVERKYALNSSGRTPPRRRKFRAEGNPRHTRAVSRYVEVHRGRRNLWHPRASRNPWNTARVAGLYSSHCCETTPSTWRKRVRDRWRAPNELKRVNDGFYRPGWIARKYGVMCSAIHDDAYRRQIHREWIWRRLAWEMWWVDDKMCLGLGLG